MLEHLTSLMVTVKQSIQRVEAAEHRCLFFKFIVTLSVIEVKFSCIINSMLDFLIYSNTILFYA